MSTDRIEMEDGTWLTPTDGMEVHCPEHGFVTTWGQLSPIQQLAFASCIDIKGEKCILEPESEAV